MNLIHMASGVWGIGLRFDPAIIPVDLRACWGAVVFWGSLTAYGAVHSSTQLLAALIVFWTAPMWAAALGGVSDPIMEYRNYSAVLGWSMLLVALLPLPAVMVLIAWWTIQTTFRSRHLRSPLAYWGHVLKENGSFGGARAENQYAQAALDAGLFFEDGDQS